MYISNRRIKILCQTMEKNRNFLLWKLLLNVGKEYIITTTFGEEKHTFWNNTDWITQCILFKIVQSLEESIIKKGNNIIGVLEK